MAQHINPFDHNRFVGYVSLVCPEHTKIHFPNSPLLKKFYHSGEVLSSGIVGNYVAIEGDGYGFLGKIVNISLPEKERLFLSESSFQNTDMHPVGTVEILLAFDVFNYSFKKGLDQFPPVGAKVYACSSEFLQQFLKGFGQTTSEITADLIDFAYLTSQEGEVIRVSANAIFGRHCAVVGSTGGGKSYTVSKLISEMLEKQGAKIILIDATGEFRTFKGSKVINAVFNNGDNASTYFHYSKLREDDLCGLFRPAGQVQLPKLQQATKNLKILRAVSDTPPEELDADFRVGIQNIADGGGTFLRKEGMKRTALIKAEKKYLPKDYMMSSDFDISCLPLQLYNECIYESDNRPGNQDKFGGPSDRDRGNCESLITRINLILQTAHFSKVFGFEMPPSSVDTNELFSIIDAFLLDDTKGLLRIDLGLVPDEQKIREILINAIGRNLLDRARSHRFEEQPVVVFMDEAHQFLNKKIKDEYSIEIELNAFERISKECRKYGLFLCIATQRPRDIPDGILSQMGCFIAHRLINQFDRDAVSKACSEATKYALAFLPVLAQGEALLMGVDFPMPIVVKIQAAKVVPDSHTPKLFKATGRL